MGTQPVDEYCREIEAYLCRKNDGHLIRVVGPSFEVVSGWAESGVPLKVAFSGIDRYFERYYRKGARRRPVKIDFCDADVLDVFDEWKRAVGAQSSAVSPQSSAHPRYLLTTDDRYLKSSVLSLRQTRGRRCFAEDRRLTTDD